MPNSIFKHSGSYYELSFQYETAEQALHAFHSLRNLPMLTTPFQLPESNVDTFSQQTTILVADFTFPCYISLLLTEEQTFFIDFGIPVESLEQVYTIDYSFNFADNEWLIDLHDCFLDIAERLYETNPFLIAVMGEEITGSFNATQLTTDDIERLQCVLPTHMQLALNVQHEGLPLSTKLALY